jgi:hypothetical protein
MAVSACACDRRLRQHRAARTERRIDGTGDGHRLAVHWHVWKFEDHACRDPKKGVRVARKGKGRPIETLHLPAEQPITLAFWYIEASYGVNRECSYTWTYTPKTGERYRARLAVARDILCSATLVDAAGAPVEVSTPENPCAIDLYGQRVPNGEPAIITIEVRVQAY